MMHANDIKTGYPFLCSAQSWSFDLIVVEEPRKSSLTHSLIPTSYGGKYEWFGFDILLTNLLSSCVCISFDMFYSHV